MKKRLNALKKSLRAFLCNFGMALALLLGTVALFGGIGVVVTQLGNIGPLYGVAGAGVIMATLLALCKTYLGPFSLLP